VSKSSYGLQPWQSGISSRHHVESSSEHPPPGALGQPASRLVALVPLLRGRTETRGTSENLFFYRRRRDHSVRGIGIYGQ